MKRTAQYVFLILLSVFLFGTVLRGSARATETGDFPIVIVRGIVSGGNPVGGESVEVVCERSGTSHTQYTETLPGGHYQTIFDGDDCNEGDTVTVNATGDGKAATASDTVDFRTVFIDITLLAQQPPLVPEFGLLTGMGALLASAGSFAMLRKREQL